MKLNDIGSVTEDDMFYSKSATFSTFFFSFGTVQQLGSCVFGEPTLWAQLTDQGGGNQR